MITTLLRFAGATLLCLGLVACAGTPPGTPARIETGTWLHLASAAASSGNRSLAVAMLAAAAERAPERRDIQLKYARALVDAGAVRKAEEIVSRALERRPDDRRLRYEAARLQVISGDLQNALQALDRLVVSDPGDVQALNARGVVLDLTGRHVMAQDSYRQALALTPNNTSIRNNLAMSMLLEGRRMEATDLLEAIRRDPGVPARVLNNLAFAYAAGGDIKRARSLASNDLSATQIDAVGELLGRVCPDAC